MPGMWNEDGGVPPQRGCQVHVDHSPKKKVPLPTEFEVSAERGLSAPPNRLAVCTKYLPLLSFTDSCN